MSGMKPSYSEADVRQRDHDKHQHMQHVINSSISRSHSADVRPKEKSNQAELLGIDESSCSYSMRSPSIGGLSSREGKARLPRDGARGRAGMPPRMGDRKNSQDQEKGSPFRFSRSKELLSAESTARRTVRIVRQGRRAGGNFAEVRNAYNRNRSNAPRPAVRSAQLSSRSIKSATPSSGIPSPPQQFEPSPSPLFEEASSVLSPTPTPLYSGELSSSRLSPVMTPRTRVRSTRQPLTRSFSLQTATRSVSYADDELSVVQYHVQSEVRSVVQSEERSDVTQDSDVTQNTGTWSPFRSKNQGLATFGDEQSSPQAATKTSSERSYPFRIAVEEGSKRGGGGGS